MFFVAVLFNFFCWWCCCYGVGGGGDFWCKFLFLNSTLTIRSMNLMILIITATFFYLRLRWKQSILRIRCTQEKFLSHLYRTNNFFNVHFLFSVSHIPSANCEDLKLSPCSRSSTFGDEAVFWCVSAWGGYFRDNGMWRGGGGGTCILKIKLTTWVWLVEIQSLAYASKLCVRFLSRFWPLLFSCVHHWFKHAVRWIYGDLHTVAYGVCAICACVYVWFSFFLKTKKINCWNVRNTLPSGWKKSSINKAKMKKK